MADPVPYVTGPPQLPAGYAQSGTIGTVLNVVQYGPATTTYTRNTTSFADVDATNLHIPFTAPSSGKVVVDLEATVNVGGVVTQYWNLRDSGGDVANTGIYVTRATLLHRARASVLVTGLTPAQAYDWKWGFAASGAVTVTIYTGSALADGGPMTMRVTAVPA